MEQFSQFSHDLTLALEETSRGVSRGRWGIRRRTRSTGNLPLAPQPTEDSSSPLELPQNCNQNDDSVQCDGSIQSDSDELHSFAFAFKMRQTTPMSGNFESDSLNENFSPARFCRPSARRKRKFKRMAVEYETTPSTPHASNNPIFGGTVKKRVLKHTCQENFRSSLFFCGKRKRGHRDRYMDYESHRYHPNQICVPRKRDLFTPKASSYLEYKSRNRTSSFTTNVKCEKILPLNKSIVSKIEKISQDLQKANSIGFSFIPPTEKNVIEKTTIGQDKFFTADSMIVQKEVPLQISQTPENEMVEAAGISSQKPIQKICPRPVLSGILDTHPVKIKSKSRKSKQSRRREMRRHLQFDDQNYMDCASMNDFLSSSSLSSSDSEAVLTNETDHEGDDELTDWPGNEVMINFTSKCDFKRINKIRAKPTLPLIKQNDDTIQDDDTLMCADDLAEKPQDSLADLASNKLNNASSMPIDIVGNVGYQHTKQIESEMSGETSNNFLSSPNTLPEIREFRAGCRRIREERPGFSIISSANEYLSRFLQDDQLNSLTLYDMNASEHDKLVDLCRLYSLKMEISNGNTVVLNKTSNTMQCVRIDSNIPKSLSDFKRRCIDTDDIEFNDLTS